MVFFSDKENTPFSISSPEEFLSQRALDRRINQNIPFSENDLPVDPAYINAVDEMDGVSIMNRLKWFNAITIWVENDAVLDEILSLPFVSQIKSSRTFKRDKPVIKPHQETTFFMKSQLAYGPSFNQIDQINGIPLHEEGFMGEGMVIAVLDAGFSNVPSISVTAPLIENGQIINTRDFTGTGDDFVYESSLHGSYVLSTMGGYMEDSLIGTAPGADYVLLKTEESETEYLVEEANWVAGAEYADSLGVDLINVSLGYTTFDDPLQDHTYADMDGNTTLITRAADIAASKGILVVNSAGNSGNEEWHFISSPADGDSVLAIGAVNSAGIHASFSSFGPSADGRIKPDVMAQGQATVVCDESDGIRTSNGTSFASPVLCGMAACLWQKHPAATNMQLADAIRQSAHLYQNPNDSMGYGIPDFVIADQILGNMVGIVEGRKPAEVHLFPNPSKSVINLVSENMEITGIEIFDAGGRTVLNSYPENSAGNINLDINSLSTGFYLVMIHSKNQVVMKKMVKQ